MKRKIEAKLIEFGEKALRAGKRQLFQNEFLACERETKVLLRHYPLDYSLTYALSFLAR